MRGVAYRSVCLRMRIHFSGNMGVSSFNNIEEQPRLSKLRYRLEWVHVLKHHDIYSIIEYNHADPNNYSQPMHNNIIIAVHNYIVVTYILVSLRKICVIIVVSLVCT